MSYYGARFDRQEREQQRLRAALAEIQQAASAPEVLAPAHVPSSPRHGTRLHQQAVPATEHVAGADGVDGADGADGTDGVDGLDGLDGTVGTNGVDGTPGVAGVPGSPGADGQPGPPGEKGDAGDQGVQGVQGVQGEAGLQGVQGETGPAGLQGPAGPIGPKGDKGDKGDQGDPGTDGLEAPVDTDATMAANSDSAVPSQKAVKTALAGKAASNLGPTRPFIIPSGEWWLTTIGVGTGYTSAGLASGTPAANNHVRYTPFYLAEDTLVDAMAIFVASANAGPGAVVAMAIYDASPATGRPRNVEVDAGTQSINAPGMKTMTFAAVSLPAGYYWAALSTRDLDTGGTNPTVAVGYVTQSISEPTPTPSNNMLTYAGGAAATFPAANPTVTVRRSVGATTPHIWLRKG